MSQRARRMPPPLNELRAGGLREAEGEQLAGQSNDEGSEDGVAS